MTFDINGMHGKAIVGLIVVLIGVGAWFTQLKPQLAQEVALQGQIASLQNDYAALKRFVEEKPQYMDAIGRIESRLNDVEVTMDARSYVPTYMSQVEALARRDGLDVTTLAPVPQPSPSATPAPAATIQAGNASSVQNAPLIGKPIAAAVRVAGASDASVAGTNVVINGTTPAPQSIRPNGTPLPTDQVQAIQQAAGEVDPRLARAAVYLGRSFQPVPMNMIVEGSFSDLERFLRDLGMFPKVIGIGNMQITAESSSAGVSPKLRATLPIIAYMLVGDGSQQPAPVPTPAPAPSSKALRPSPSSTSRGGGK